MFYKDEAKDVVIAVSILTLIFWIVLGRYNVFLLPLFGFIVVISFLGHELAHRWVATKFGYIAFFKLFFHGILLGVLFALMGWILVAPGAVMIHPTPTAVFKSYRRRRREWGLIAAAGPAVNLLFGLLFSFIVLMQPNILALINIWLAFFNLLPFPPLDGSKVFAWSWKVWLLLMAFASLLLIFTFFKVE